MLPIHDFQHPRENFASSSHSTPSTSDRHHVDGAGIDHVNEAGRTALYRAVLECDEKEVETLLNQGAKIGLCDPTTKNSPLHVAAALGNSRILKLLVRAARTQGGNLINLENENGMTPLRVATMHNNAVAVKELLRFKGDRRVARINLNTRCNRQITPLMAAVSKKNLIMVELLADVGADFELRGPNRKTAFHAAAALGSYDVMRVLWNGAFRQSEKILMDMLEATDENQDTPLFITVNNGNVDMAKKLLVKESRLKDQPSRCRNGVATLIRAVQRKETYAAQTLLEAASAADLLHIMMDIKDENGNTLLHTAAQNGDQATVRLLLEFDAAPFAENDAGETPFVHALNSLHTRVAHILLEAVNESSAAGESKYQDVKKMTFVRDKLGRTPLEVAIMENDPDLARRIAAIPDNLRYRVLQDQTTMLHLAVKQDRYDIVLILIKEIEAAGIEFNTQFDLINLPDSGKWTPLLSAIKTENDALVQLLLEHGADVSATTPKNFNVLHLAAKHASSQINVKRLLKAAKKMGLDVAMIHARTTKGYTPLMAAADVGNYPMVEYLLDIGAQQRDRNNFGNAALHRALAKSYDDSIEILIEFAGIDKGRGRNLLELRGEYRYTPLLAAADVGDSKWVGRLLEYGADLFAQDEYGRNIIGIAAECGYTDVIETVLRSPVARGIVVELVNHPDERGNTPLLLVAKRDVNEAAEVEVVPEDEVELAAYLEAAIARHDRDEVAPSNTAAAKNAATAKLLIDNGANLRHRNKNGSTAVGLAVSTGNNDVAELVLAEEKRAIASRKLDGSTKLVNIANERGLAPLGIAAISGREEAVPLLLEYDPDLMHRTSETFKSEEMGLDFIEGDTALHLALFGEKEEIAKKLIERAKATGLKALITAQNRGGTMALDHAVKKRLESATYELLRTGWIEPADIKRNRNLSDGMFMFGAIATLGNVALLTSTLKHFGVFNKKIPDIATLFNWALDSDQVEKALAYIAVLLPVIDMVGISNNEKGAVFENREELLDIAFDETIHKSDDQVDEEGRLARLEDAQLAEQQIEYHTRRVYANTILTEVGGIYIECIRDPFEKEERSEEEKSRIVTVAKELDNGLKSGESTGEFDEDFLKVVAAIYVASVTESEFTDQPDSSDVRDKPYAPLHKFFDKIAAHDVASKKVLELVNSLKLNKKHDNGLVTLPLDNAGIFDKAMLARMTPGAQLTWKNLSRYQSEDAAAKSKRQAESRSSSPGIEVRDLGRRRTAR